MQTNQPQGFKSFELANAPQSGIGEAARNRLQTVTAGAHLAYMALPKPVEQLNQPPQTTQNYNVGAVATAYSHDKVSQQIGAVAPAYPQEAALQQQIATQNPETADFLKPEELRNNIDSIYDEITAERNTQQQQIVQNQSLNREDYDRAA